MQLCLTLAHPACTQLLFQAAEASLFQAADSTAAQSEHLQQTLMQASWQADCARGSSAASDAPPPPPGDARPRSCTPLMAMEPQLPCRARPHVTACPFQRVTAHCSRLAECRLSAPEASAPPMMPPRQREAPQLHPTYGHGAPAAVQSTTSQHVHINDPLLTAGCAQAERARGSGAASGAPQGTRGSPAAPHLRPRSPSSCAEQRGQPNRPHTARGVRQAGGQGRCYAPTVPAAL